MFFSLAGRRGWQNVRGSMRGSLCPFCGSTHEAAGVCAASPRLVVARAEVGERQLVGRVIGDRYGVTKLLGAGAMGEVYEAEHLALGRMVAIKVVRSGLRGDREAAARLRHEARVAASVEHPNVCEVFDVGRLDDGSPFVVMERLHGRTFAGRLKADPCMAWPELRELALQVLSALATAHEKGIVHCDLKPENVFLGQRPGIGPVAKILDFGIARTGGSDEAGVVTSVPGGVDGTPYYMAPEQARGDRELDGRVDLWAVGVMLYEALLGRLPFDASNYNALLVQILTAKHVPVAMLRVEVPAGVSRVVDRALSKAREDRFATGLEMLEALARVEVFATVPVGRAMVPPPKAGAFFQLEETVVIGAAAGASAAPVGAGRWDPGGSDPESTLVDEPSFLDDSVTVVRREGGFAVRPKAK